MARQECDYYGSWKLLGTYTGAQTITLPSEYQEIMLAFWDGRGANHAYDNYVRIIPKEALLSTKKTFIDSITITSQSFNAYISYEISRMELTIGSSFYGGQSHIADLETQVFYR